MLKHYKSCGCRDCQNTRELIKSDLINNVIVNILKWRHSYMKTTHTDSDKTIESINDDSLISGVIKILFFIIIPVFLGNIMKLYFKKFIIMFF